MKFFIKIPLAIFLIIVLLPTLIIAQSNSMVLFNKDYLPDNSSQKIPFGEKILFKSKDDMPGLEKLTIEISHGINTQIVDADINENGWSAIVGPFDQKQSLLINFKVKKTLIQRDWDSIFVSLKKTAQTVIDSLASRNESWSDSELSILCSRLFIDALSPELKKYKAQDGTTAYDLMLKFIKDQINPQEFIDLSNKSIDVDSSLARFHRAIREIKNDFVNKGIDSTDSQNIKNKKTEWKKIKPEDLPSDNDDSIEVAFERLLKKLNKAEAVKSNIQTDIETLKGYVDDLREASTVIRSKIENIIGKNILYTSQIYSASLSEVTNIDVSGIQKYIGVDVGWLAYDKGKAVVANYILLSPYFLKIEPDDDLELCKKKNIWEGIFTVFTPTVGIQIISYSRPDSTIGITFFAGGSLRINKIVRFTMGDSFFGVNDKFKHHWSMGLSISVSDVGNLLKIVGGAASNFKP